MVRTSPPVSRRSSSPRERGKEAGYNLVMLMVLVTVVNVVLAAAMPMWSHVIQRDKEEELIFRGFQYAEAIRLFQLRFQRLPVRLEELMEVKPRCIRQLWKDPMTESGKWSLVFEGMGQNLTPQPEDPNGRSGPGAKEPPEEPADGGEGGEGEEGEEDGSGFGGPGKGDEVAVGPIKGVRSRSGKASILVFNGRERYDEWQFSTDLLLQQQSVSRNQQGGIQGVGPGGAAQPVLSTRWIGRPWPKFIEPPQPQDGGLPGDPSRPNPRNRRNNQPSR